MSFVKLFCVFSLLAAACVSNAQICDFRSVPKTAITSEGQIALYVVFKRGVELNNLKWLASYGQITRIARNEPGILLLVRCATVVPEMAKHDEVLSIRYSQMGPVTDRQSPTIISNQILFNRLQP